MSERSVDEATGPIRLIYLGPPRTRSNSHSWKTLPLPARRKTKAGWGQRTKVAKGLNGNSSCLKPHGA